MWANQGVISWTRPPPHQPPDKRGHDDAPDEGTTWKIEGRRKGAVIQLRRFLTARLVKEVVAHPVP